ncbi:MAG: 4-hydroxy-3-methylbut-2-enyl diphosphate reductase [Acidimicrobiia bacterium]
MVEPDPPFNRSTSRQRSTLREAGIQIERVLVSKPRGFCAGVEMAIKALVWMLRIFGPPVYCYHQIVHNRSVVEAFEKAGVVFIEDISDVPGGAPVMLSAHGSAPQVVKEAERRGGFVVDAVCPLVTKVHHEARTRAKRNYEIVYIGHKGHDEAVGTMAVAPESMHLVESRQELENLELRSDRAGVALLAQTTLSHFEWEGILEEAKARFGDLWLPGREDLCYATTNRQKAVMELARRADAILVVGSANSSNTNALVSVGKKAGCERTARIDGPDDIDPAMLESAKTVGLTAGASCPESLVEEVIAYLAPSAGVEVLSVIDEDEYFPLPPKLRELLAERFGSVVDDRKVTAADALAELEDLS